MSALSEKSAFEAFARMEERIDKSERQIRATAEIDETFTGDALAKDFKQLERSAGGADADAHLLALKQKMGLLPGGAPQGKALGAGRPAGQAAGAEDDIPDGEAEELRPDTAPSPPPSSPSSPKSKSA
jgi:phage shock protein A